MIDVGPERGLECLVDCLLVQILDDVDRNVSLLMGERSVAGEMGDAGREDEQEEDEDGEFLDREGDLKGTKASSGANKSILYFPVEEMGDGLWLWIGETGVIVAFEVCWVESKMAVMMR